MPPSLCYLSLFLVGLPNALSTSFPAWTMNGGPDEQNVDVCVLLKMESESKPRSIRILAVNEQACDLHRN
jgi:hypothetical protein